MTEGPSELDAQESNESHRSPLRWVAAAVITVTLLALVACETARRCELMTHS